MKLSLVTITESVEKIDLGELLGIAVEIVEDDPETAAKMLKFYEMARSKRGGDLNAHHVKFFSVILRENSIQSRDQARSCLELWDINNGITLCKVCHDTVHYSAGED